MRGGKPFGWTGWRRGWRWLTGALAAMAFSAAAAEDHLADIRSRFSGEDKPIVMEYQLGYRVLNIELARLGKITVTTTTGKWRHRLTGSEIPAVFVAARIDSDDRGQEREKSRASIHDEIVAVLTLPELEALLFAKVTDEQLRPLLGRRSVALAVSRYDTQGEALEYRQENLATGTVVTNLSHPEDLMKLSRQVGPIMDFLGQRYRANGDTAPVRTNNVCISANLDGHVVALRLDTRKERSPYCFDRRRLESLRIRTLPVSDKQAHARDFYAWATTFDALADYMGDEKLKTAACESMVAAVTPLVVDYELAIGRIRADMVSVKVEEANHERQ